jgi:hypothetical protein
MLPLFINNLKDFVQIENEQVTKPVCISPDVSVFEVNDLTLENERTGL